MKGCDLQRRWRSQNVWRRSCVCARESGYFVELKSGVEWVGEEGLRSKMKELEDPRSRESSLFLMARDEAYDAIG